MIMKYIVYEHMMGMEVPVVFSTMQNHDDVLKKIHNPIGAGFCRLENGRFICYGKSTSLDLDSRGEKDSDILNIMLLKTK